jgi:hypothetical protein
MFEEIKKLIEKNDLEKTLAAIYKILEQASSDEESLLQLIDAPEIDSMLQSIGKKILQKDSNLSFKKNKPINKNLNVYITEEVYSGGGHTREIEEWIESTYKERENIVIVTGFFYNSHKDQLQKFKDKNIKFLINYNATSKDRVSNIKWLQDQLLSLRPEVIFLSTTRLDIVSIAALQSEVIDKLYLNLSLDHGISPGIHIPHLTKIIVKRPYLYFYIKKNIGLNNLIYIPFNKSDFTNLNNITLECRDYIVTASCTYSSQKIESSYVYNFTEIIPGIIKATKGRHFHIGAISSQALEDLYRNMDMLDLDRNLFTRIEFVDNLAIALIEKKVDILIQTFPLSGGLVTIEAMQAGVMIINHKHLYSYLFNIVDFCYEGSFFWKEEKELYGFLSKLSKEEILTQKKNSRNCYLQYHSPKSIENLVKIDNFIGVNAEILADFIAKEYDYNLNYFAKSLAKANKNNIIKHNYKRRSILYRLKKSLRKRWYKLLQNI